MLVVSRGAVQAARSLIVKGHATMSAPLFATASPLAVNVLDAQSLLGAFGVLGVGVVLFAETGLPVVALIVGVSLSPLLAEILRSRRAAAGRRSGAGA